MPKKQILVIDDSEDTLDIMKFYLELNNYHVVTKNNGQSCIDYLSESSAIHPIPDLILLDMNLGDMTGVGLANRIAVSNLNKSPIVFLTGQVDTDINSKYEVLKKPVDIDILLETVGRRTAEILI